MIKLIEHPIVAHNLTTIRNKDTQSNQFRSSVDTIALFLAMEATKHLPTSKTTIQTPMEEYEGEEIGTKVVYVPVLRAGLALLNSFRNVYPDAGLSFVGLSRNESSFEAEEYYFSSPATTEKTKFIILEMMIATGGSVRASLSRLQMEGANDFTICSVISAPEGVEAILTEYPNVEIITASLDRGLNQQKYIVPGLGDAGDRWCGF